MAQDWRNISKSTDDRQAQLSARGANKGIIGAYIDSSSGENQTAKLVYSGGEKNVPLPMPFDSATSWIRSIPEAATQCIIGYRADIEDPTFISYVNESPKSKLQAYQSAQGLYRPLLPGEHEVHSAGLANIYFSARPNLEMRGGLIRSWLDQDRLEAGQKAPLHVRQIWEHQSNNVGDEERFGVVRRPMQFLLNNPAAAVLALSPTSYNFYDYPYPDFSLPGGVPFLFNVTAQAAATASEVALGLVGEFKKRPFAKEYLKVIKNPTFPLPPNDKLIDIREGQVFDDMGLQAISFSSGAYIRAKYEYYTALTDATVVTIDEIGNMSWDLSLGALTGFSFSAPAGGMSISTTLDTEISCLNFSADALLSAGISAVTDVSLDAILNTNFSTGLNHTHDVTGQCDLNVTLNSTHATKLNLTLDAGVNLDAKAGVKMTLNAPLVDIGSSPAEPTVMGEQLTTWLSTLLDALQKAQPIGNLGAPVLFTTDPALVATITQLKVQLELLKSKTIKVSP